MFQDKAGEHVIKLTGRERHGVHVGLLKHHVPESGGSNALLRSGQGVLGYIHRDDRGLGATLRQRDRLSTDPTPDFKNRTSWWVERIGVQELGERVGLIGEAFPLAARISVYVVLPSIHGASLLSARGLERPPDVRWPH